MTVPRIRMVCFDVGGVLVRHCRTWSEGCAAAGLPLHAEAEGAGLAQARKELARLLTTGKIEPEEFYTRMSATTRGLYSTEDVRRIHHAWLGPEYAGVGEVVGRLVRAGRVQTGVLSNTNIPHWSRFESRGGAPPEFPTAALLSNHHASHILGFMKPEAAAYEAFERATGCAGSEVLFLEDLPDNIGAARQRGWTCELIDYTRETAPQIEAVLARFGLI